MKTAKAKQMGLGDFPFNVASVHHDLYRHVGSPGRGI
jgi:hypothetical protein